MRALTVTWPAKGAASVVCVGLGGSSDAASATPAGRARAVPASASAVVVVGLMITSLRGAQNRRAAFRFRFRRLRKVVANATVAGSNLAPARERAFVNPCKKRAV